MIQIITTNEEMQIAFDRAVVKAMQNYQHTEIRIEPLIVAGNEVCRKFDITMPTLIRWRQKGRIPFMQIGSAIRYDLNKVIEALKVSGKKKGVKSS